jgi:hypothetical protein
MVWIRCGGCGSQVEVPEAQRSMRCPYCAAATVLAPEGAAVQPTFLLPFSVDERAAREAMKEWLESPEGRRLPKVVRRSPLRAVVGTFVPVWVFGARARSRWNVQIGEHWTETVQERVVDSNGRETTRTRVIRHTEWQPLMGMHDAWVSDVLVSGSKGISGEAIGALGPFDLRMLQRYDSALISGFLAESHAVDDEDARGSGRAEARAQIAKGIERFMPGDEYRHLHCETKLDSETLESLLVPVWIARVSSGGALPASTLVVNGQTGAAWGTGPRDPGSLAQTLLEIAIFLGVLGGIGYALWRFFG